MSLQNRAIALSPSILRAHAREEIEHRIRRIVRSVRFELLEQGNAMRILGPDMSYHGADPYLPEGLRKLSPGMTLDEVFHYRARRANFDLCLEDSWSGYFIAEHLSERVDDQDVVLIHLDDHTDMMATLLERSACGLTNPGTGESFDPAASVDWEASIGSGCVSIGNFVTPLYYLPNVTHVRHLNNFLTSTHRLYNVTHESCCYDLIPGRAFAGIRKKTSGWGNSAGTYLGGPDAVRVLDDLPAGRVIAHLDLDYFINDFNGNLGEFVRSPKAGLRLQALGRLDRFFDALHGTGRTVDRWIVATSPGFCSVDHWDWLLTEIDRRIEHIRMQPG